MRPDVVELLDLGTGAGAGADATGVMSSLVAVAGVTDTVERVVDARSDSESVGVVTVDDFVAAVVVAATAEVVEIVGFGAVVVSGVWVGERDFLFGWEV